MVHKLFYSTLVLVLMTLFCTPGQTCDGCDMYLVLCLYDIYIQNTKQDTHTVYILLFLMYKKYIDICILTTVVHKSSLVSSCGRQGSGNICCCVQTMDQVASEFLLELRLQQPLLLFLLCCFSSGCCWWMQSVALVSVPVCNSVSVAVQLLDKRFPSSASFSLVVYVKNLR